MSTIAHERFEAVIGLEVHAQLLTKSKAFAPVAAQYGEAPNTQVSPLCLGHPGTLPVINENLVRYIIKMGLATDCSVAPKSIFARKNLPRSSKGISDLSIRHSYLFRWVHRY